MKPVRLETLAVALVLAGCTAERAPQRPVRTELKDAAVYIGWLGLDQWDEDQERLEGVAVVSSESLVEARGLPPTSWSLGDHGWLIAPAQLQSIRAAIGGGLVHRDAALSLDYLGTTVIAFQFRGRGRYLALIDVPDDTRRSLLMLDGGVVELDSQLVDLLCNAYGWSAFPD